MGIVALRGDDALGSQDGGHLSGEVIGASDMSGEHRDGMLSAAVYADHGGVGMLVFHEGGNGAHADAHGTDEDEGVVVFPFLVYVAAKDASGAQLVLEHLCDVLSFLADGYGRYFLHFSISMGL